MRKLGFTQTLTLLIAALCLLILLKPNWVSDSPTLAAWLPNSDHDTPRSYAPAVKKAAPAVVNIINSSENRDANPQAFSHPFLSEDDAQDDFGLGSGVILDQQGHILTNYHVIEDAAKLDISLSDGRQTTATVVGIDPETDLAILKINLPNLPTIQMADPSSLEVGDIVLAIGNPFGVGQTTTMGIVSALGRTQLGINTFEDFIQTDAAINPGNSGGALIDTHGRLVGINTAIYSQTGGSLGIGFAIPIKSIQKVIAQLIDKGSVTRGYLGIEPQDLTPELASVFGYNTHVGIIVTVVQEDSPAQRAGIRPGDILTQINQTKISNSMDLLNTVANLTPKEQAVLHLVREGKPILVDITVGLRPQQ